MKKLLLGMFVLVSVSLSAQTMSGNWLVGGDAGFDSYKPDGATESLSKFNVSPQIGYFIMDNLAVGALIDYTKGYDKSSTIGLGPAVRYYFLDLGESAKLLAQVNFLYKSITPDGGSATSGSQFGVSAGLAWFLNHHVALEGLVGYRSDSGDLGKGSGIGVNFGFQIHLGGE